MSLAKKVLGKKIAEAKIDGLASSLADDAVNRLGEEVSNLESQISSTPQKTLDKLGVTKAEYFLAMLTSLDKKVSDKITLWKKQVK